jgi:hypothetical protein
MEDPDWTKAGCPRYSRLEVYADLDGQSPARLVEVGSESEKEIIAALREFLISPIVDVPFVHRTPEEHFLEHVRELLLHIPNRVRA